MSGDPFRTVDSSLWYSSEWFAGLTTEAKLLWLCLFTNPHARLTGLYPITRTTLAAMTGLDTGTVTAILEQFEHGEPGQSHAIYRDGWLWVTGMRARQVKNTSPKLLIHIRGLLDNVPDGELLRAYYVRYPEDRPAPAPAPAPDPAPDPAPGPIEAPLQGDNNDTNTLPIGYGMGNDEQETVNDKRNDPPPDYANWLEKELDGKGDDRSAEITEALAYWLGVMEGTALQPLLSKMIEEKVRLTSPGVVLAAMREAVSCGKTNWQYTAAIADRYQREGVPIPPPSKTKTRRSVSVSKQDVVKPSLPTSSYEGVLEF